MAIVNRGTAKSISSRVKIKAGAKEMMVAIARPRSLFPFFLIMESTLMAVAAANR